MRLCASLFRGVAAPLGCVICLQLGDVAVFSLCAQYFLNVRGGGGITTLGGLCVLLKRWMAACQKGCSVSGRSDTLIREPLQCLQENELTECQGTGYLPFTIRSLRCK